MKAGPGRPKGSPNKLTADIKAAILSAFQKVGGAAYLETVAVTKPEVFCSLLAKVLPTQIAGDGEDGALTVVIKRFTDAGNRTPE